MMLEGTEQAVGRELPMLLCTSMDPGYYSADLPANIGRSTIVTGLLRITAL